MLVSHEINNIKMLKRDLKLCIENIKTNDNSENTNKENY